MREHIVMAPRGWIIEVRFFQGDTEIVQRYDVAIANPEDAVIAVRHVIGLGDSVRIRVEEQLFDATFFGLGLTPGAIHPRVRRQR
jgi:hypothetical protein